MIGTLTKLLKHPHRAVFDLSPDASAAFYISGSKDVAWSVSDGQLTVKMDETARTYDLSEFTVGSLINRLKADKFTISFDTSVLFGRSALVLVDGKGASTQSDGSKITGFKSLLWALYSSYSVELKLAKYQVSQALRQMVIWQSEGEWTDVWGGLFGVSRKNNEIDQNYATRIPKEAFRIRVNKFAIEITVKELTGQTIVLRETWPDMFRLDEASLSSGYRFPSEEEWRYGYLQPTSRSLFDWTEALSIIERNKAAGVIILPPITDVSYVIDAQLNGSVAVGLLSSFGTWVSVDDGVRLDIMQLGNSLYNRNWRVLAETESFYRNESGLHDEARLGISSVRQPVLAALSDAGLRPLTTIMLDDTRPIGINFNNWSSPRKWADGDTWASRGASVPRSVQVKTDTTT